MDNNGEVLHVPLNGIEADLAFLTEMTPVSAEEVGARAIHLAAELVRHYREGGQVILRKGWKSERIMFTDFDPSN